MVIFCMVVVRKCYYEFFSFLCNLWIFKELLVIGNLILGILKFLIYSIISFKFIDFIIFFFFFLNLVLNEIYILLNGIEYCFKIVGDINVILCRRKVGYDWKLLGKNFVKKIDLLSFTKWIIKKFFNMLRDY